MNPWAILLIMVGMYVAVRVDRWAHHPDRCNTKTTRTGDIRNMLEQDNEIKFREALTIALQGLRRLSYADEMAGMGSPDDNPEVMARCRYAETTIKHVNRVLGNGVNE